jgi:hypothetical protein
MTMKRILPLTAALVAVATLSPHAYVLTGPKWAVSQVPYYINPVNGDVTQADAIAAIQAGANNWSAQSNANISLYYMGTTSGNTLQNNGKNEVFFRNATNGGLLAETYWWGDSTGHFVDADIVFYDAGFTFYGNSGVCTGTSGVYIQDTVTHEFGHMLGMAHSTVSTATMWPTEQWCSTSWRTLDPDDQAGIEALYPPVGTTTATPPSLSISSPSASTSTILGTATTFSGTATDQKDGTLTSRIVWSSSLVGQLGIGGTVIASLPLGSNIVTAAVTDSSGLTTTKQVTVSVSSPTTTTPPPPSTTTFTLSASGSKVKGSQRVNLSWTGATSSTVDVYRNGARISTVNNTGSMTDAINRKGGGTYTYQVCNAGTSTCSNTAQVVF